MEPLPGDGLRLCHHGGLLAVDINRKVEAAAAEVGHNKIGAARVEDGVGNTV